MQDQTQIPDAREVGSSTLAYERSSRPWWRQPRWQMAVGIGCLAFGYGLTLTYWPGPPVFMGFGCLLLGLAVPLPDDGR